jgi:fructose-specific phosphotransferase system IIC component
LRAAIDADGAPPDEASAERNASPAPPLVEWWRDDDARDLATADAFADAERRRAWAFGGMLGAVGACIALGWLAGPALAPLLESLTGSPADDTGALRSLGAFVGLLGGLFVGAVVGWVTWSSK